MATTVRVITKRGAVHQINVLNTPLDLVSFVNGQRPHTFLVFVGVNGDLLVVLCKEISSMDFLVAKEGA